MDLQPARDHPAAPPDHRLEAKQVEVLYDQALVSIPATLATSALLVVILWPVSPAATLLSWFGLIALISLARGWLVLRFRAARDKERAAHPWLGRMIAGTALSASLWGLATPLLPPDTLIHMGLTTLWVCGMAAGSIVSLSAVRWAFAAFVLPAMLPTAAFLILHGGTPELTMGGAVLLFAAFLSFNGTRLHRSVTDSLRLQFENSDLIADLAAEKHRIERLNAELEARVAERTAELSAANAAKSRFLAAASHDLRQPLQALTLMQASLAATVREPDALRIVGDMGVGLWAAAHLLDDLLDITRLEGGGVKPRIADARVGWICTRLVREFRPQAEQKGLRLRMIPSRAVVRTDPQLLERILRNLLSNAIKYTDRGKVLLGCRRRGDRLHIQVWDTGRGIPEDQLGQIFEEFYQLENPGRERGTGQGLGLAIVERTARLLGHRLLVRSTPGRGSLFAVDVPLGDPDAATESQGVPEPGPPPTEGLQLILVEDDPDVREALRILLRLRGFRLETGRTGQEAAERCERSGLRPDLAIVDYRLGDGESGLDVVVRLRQGIGGEAMAAILLTGDSSPELDRAAREGGCRLLRKPVEPRTLISQIREATQDHRRSA